MPWTFGGLLTTNRSSLPSIIYRRGEALQFYAQLDGHIYTMKHPSKSSCFKPRNVRLKELIRQIDSA